MKRMKKLKLITVYSLMALPLIIAGLYGSSLPYRIGRKVNNMLNPLTEYVPGNHEYYIDKQWDFFINRSRSLDRMSTTPVIFGDSHVNGLPFEEELGALNFGISGETVQHASKRISGMWNLDYRMVILAYGINDIHRPTDSIISDYKDLICNVTFGAGADIRNVRILEVLPVNPNLCDRSNDSINVLNKKLRGLGVKTINTRKYLGKTLPLSFQKGDGLHLNPAGNQLWLRAIKEGL